MTGAQTGARPIDERDHLPRVLNPAWAQAAVILAGLALWAFFLPHTTAAAPWIYSWDSAAYLEAAESLHAGRGVSQRVIEGLGPDIWMPMTWWPPGYSVLVYAVHLFDVPVKNGCLIAAGASGAFAVVILGAISMRLFHWAVALPLTAAVAASVAFQKASVQCMSDTSYFSLVLASAGCLVFWMTDAKTSLRWILTAGLFAGAAWATRNTGLALFAATGILFAVLLARLRPQRVFVIGAVWAAGVAVCALPTIVHNLIVFGRINAYHMPPSELSLLTNLRRAAQVAVADLTTSDFLADFVASHVLALAGVGGAALAIAGWSLARRGMPAVAKALYDNRLQLFLLAYAGAYGAIVILARTKYRWGEQIDARHMFQIYWPLWICAALWARALFERWDWSRARSPVILAIAFVAVAALQTRALAQYTARPAPRLETMEGRLGAQACAHLREAAGAETVVLSTRAEILRVHCDVNARKLPPVDQYYKLKPLTRDDLQQAGESGLLWGVVIEDVALARRGGLGPLVRDMVENPERQPGFRHLAIDSPAVILEWRGLDGSQPGLRAADRRARVSPGP